MRNNIVYEGADELTYEIREIAEVAQKMESAALKFLGKISAILWQKVKKFRSGSKISLLDTVKNDDSSFAYSPTRGLLETREYIAKERNLEGGIQIGADNILFFNGLGDAISKVYTYLNSHARMIGPNPAYSTHSSAEAGACRCSAYYLQT